MLQFFHYVTCTVTTSLLLGIVPVWGEESIRQESQLLADVSLNVYKDRPAQEEMLLPSIDITSNGFASNLKKTNWEFGTEVLLLQTDYGNIDFSGENGDKEIVGSLRFYLGWENESGFGIRGRIWGHETESKAESINFSGLQASGRSIFRGFDFRGAAPASTTSEQFELGVGTIDLDFYKRFGTDQTSILLGTGLKIAALRFDVPTVLETRISTGGVSLFSNLRHVLYRSNQSELAFVGSGRVAFLGGEWESKDGTTYVENDTDMTITEAALGLEWKRDLGWSLLTLRGQYETQLWNSDVTRDVVFNGGAIRAGLSW